MKKILAILLSMTMCIGLTACGGSTGAGATTAAPAVTGASGNTESAAPAKAAADHKKFKIGILEAQLNDESTNRASYFKDYVGPQYNCEFMFSEACSDLNTAMTFVENAADAGCDAIINYYAYPANTEQLVLLCQEKGMVLVENTGCIAANEAAYAAHYDNFGGGFQADQPATGKLFKDYLTATMDPSVSHNFIVATGGAYQGNQQQTEISTNMLEAIAEIYDLKYDSTITELITSSSPVQATNDKGLDIYCYPGMPTASGWLEGLSAALQTGKYDYLLTAPNVIGNIGNAVSEVEVALDKDITLVGFCTFGDALTNAFNTKDKFGNQSLSMSTVKFTSLVNAMGFSKAYNMLTGYSDAVCEANGDPAVISFRMQAVTTPEQLAEMSSWDTPGKWVADYDVIDSFLGANQEGLTVDQVQERIYAVDYDSIKVRLSK